MTSGFVTIDKVAEFLSVSVSTIRLWVRNQTIPKTAYIKIGNIYRFSIEDVVDALTIKSEMRNNDAEGDSEAKLVDTDGTPNDKDQDTDLQGPAGERNTVDELSCGNGELSYADGTVYEGEIFEGKPHGKGKLRYLDKALYFDYVDLEDSRIIYEGEFFDGTPHGKGKIIDELDGSMTAISLMGSRMVKGNQTMQIWILIPATFLMVNRMEKEF